MGEVLVIFKEHEACKNYVEVLEDANKYLESRVMNCEQRIASFEKVEHYDKEIDKNEKKKCNSIKVQRDIYGVTSVVLGVGVLILLIL